MNGTLDGGWIYGCEEGGRRKDDLDCGHTIPHPHHTTPCPGGPIYRIVLYCIVIRDGPETPYKREPLTILMTTTMDDRWMGK